MSDPWRNRITGTAMINPEQLLASDANWRIHPQTQKSALMGVLDEVGWVQDVIVQAGTDMVIDGHLRVAAALQRGEPTIPVCYVDLTDAEAALVLATLDPLAALAGTDSDKLSELLAVVSTGEAAVQAMLGELAANAGIVPKMDAPEDAGPQDDRADELREWWDTATGQLWEIPSLTCPGRVHRVLCGDSTNAEGMAQLEIPLGSSLVFDPPWDAPVSVPGGDWPNILAFSDGRRIGDIVRAFGAPGWLFVWDCVSCWYTPNRPLQRMKLCAWYGAVEQFNCNGAHYGDVGEPRTIWNTRGSYDYVPDIRGKHLADVYKEPITRLHSDGPSHSKPVDWMRLLIGDCAMADVYDPYVGSGTTIVACEQLGRIGYGMEIEPKYVAVTLQRLSDIGLEPHLVDPLMLPSSSVGAS